MLSFYMLTFKMAFKCQERSCSFSLKRVNSFEMHLEHKLQPKCKINSFEMQFKCTVNI